MFIACAFRSRNSPSKPRKKTGFKRSKSGVAGVPPQGSKNPSVLSIRWPSRGGFLAAKSPAPRSRYTGAAAPRRWSLQDELRPARARAGVEQQLEAAIPRLRHAAHQQLHIAVQVPVRGLEGVAIVHDSDGVLGPRFRAARPSSAVVVVSGLICRDLRTPDPGCLHDTVRDVAWPTPSSGADAEPVARSPRAAFIPPSEKSGRGLPHSKNWRPRRPPFVPRASVVECGAALQAAPLSRGPSPGGPRRRGPWPRRPAPSAIKGPGVGGSSRAGATLGTAMAAQRRWRTANWTRP